MSRIAEPQPGGIVPSWPGTVRLAVEIKFAPCSEDGGVLAVRNALPIIDHDDGTTWYESFAADAFLVGGQGARITHGHDGEAIGSVIVAIARGAWHYADAVIETNDPAVLERIHEGRPVSIDAKSLKRDDDELTRTRRHRLAQLQAVALLADGERPWYEHAKITRVREITAGLLRGGADVPSAAPPVTGGTIRREGIGQVLGLR